MRVQKFTNQDYTRTQQQWLREGCDVVVATAGKLNQLLIDEPGKVNWWGRCKAIVFDEVDNIIDYGFLRIDDVRSVIRNLQFIFVTATLGEAAQQELEVFEAMERAAIPSDQAPENGRSPLRRHKGGGLHKLSPLSQHILIDCTPMDYFSINTATPEGREYLTQQTVLALAWHLKHGVLKDVDKVVVFCNKIDEIRLVEILLKKQDWVKKQTNTRHWMVFTVHKDRGDKINAKHMKLFTADTVFGVNAFKKRILITSDVMSRGIDFGVEWVVLLQFPPTAAQYIRRAGRTCRGGRAGGVMSMVTTPKNLKLAQKITAAAIRSVRLVSDKKFDTSEKGALERFDPKAKDWRSAAAASPKPRMEDIDLGDEQDEEELQKRPEPQSKQTADEKVTDKDVRDVFNEMDATDFTGSFSGKKGKKGKKGTTDSFDMETASSEWAPWQEDDLFDDLGDEGDWGDDGVGGIGISLD